MIRLFAIVLVVHGLIHLLGFVKAFRLAELPQLRPSISAPFGLVWLAASILFIATAGSVFVWPRWWWGPGAVAVCVSMVAISRGEARWRESGNDYAYIELEIDEIAYAFSPSATAR